MTSGCCRDTPDPPYYAVIFSSSRTEGDRGYGQMADRMLELAAQQPGFLGSESARSANGFGITVSYWATAEAIVSWKQHTDHKAAQQAGKRGWYSENQVRIARVERAYGADRALPPVASLDEPFFGAGNL